MDLKLIKAYYLKQQFAQDGYPVWIDRSDRVTFEVKSFVSKSAAAIERRQARDAESEQKNYGKRYYAVPVVIDGGEMPTMREYMDEQARLRGDKPNHPPN